jgi:hypothetical protein
MCRRRWRRGRGSCCGGPRVDRRWRSRPWLGNATARRLFQLVEPVAVVTYLAPEPTEAVMRSAPGRCGTPTERPETTECGRPGPEGFRGAAVPSQVIYKPSSKIGAPTPVGVPAGAHRRCAPMAARNWSPCPTATANRHDVDRSEAAAADPRDACRFGVVHLQDYGPSRRVMAGGSARLQVRTASASTSEPPTPRCRCGR